jgi:hypothetical protein
LSSSMRSVSKLKEVIMSFYFPLLETDLSS